MHRKERGSAKVTKPSRHRQCALPVCPVCNPTARRRSVRPGACDDGGAQRRGPHCAPGGRRGLEGKGLSSGSAHPRRCQWACGPDPAGDGRKGVCGNTAPSVVPDRRGALGPRRMGGGRPAASVRTGPQGRGTPRLVAHGRDALRTIERPRDQMAAGVCAGGGGRGACAETAPPPLCPPHGRVSGGPPPPPRPLRDWGGAHAHVDGGGGGLLRLCTAEERARRPRRHWPTAPFGARLSSGACPVPLLCRGTRPVQRVLRDGHGRTGDEGVGGKPFRCLPGPQATRAGVWGRPGRRTHTDIPRGDTHTRVRATQGTGHVFVFVGGALEERRFGGRPF